MNTFDQNRILALGVHPKSFGFAIFEDGKLLDWGARSFPRRVRVPPCPKIRGLIAEYLPEAIVLRQPKYEKSAHMLSEIGQAAKAEQIALHALPPQLVKRVFANQNNKNQIASEITQRYPELLSLLPPRRKNWMNEDYRMKIFDAVATGIAYFLCKRQEITFSAPQS